MTGGIWIVMAVTIAPAISKWRITELESEQEEPAADQT